MSADPKLPTPTTSMFGLETEFGIARGEHPDLDVVAESIALVRSAAEPGILMRWDYAAENPHRDMRGFEVDELRQDFDESNYVAQDSRRALSFTEIKSDFVFGNGARFYNDHAHPEYCTPECAQFQEVVSHDRAGERIAMACAAELSRARGETVRLYKNNTDFRGHSYGCHENYLVPRALEWQALASAVQGFLVTRQIYAGAGKFAIEAEDRFVSHGFQISQRADFFSELQSVDTMQRRPLVNTRDEPHADPLRWRRFHVILGDANLMPYATWLKVGATALVLEAIQIQPTRRWPVLADPLGDLRTISRDPDFRWLLSLAGDRPSSALDVQREYLTAVRSLCDLSDVNRSALVECWDAALDDLARDPDSCSDRLDWVAKRKLIRQFQEAEGIDDHDPWLRSLDLEYHRLDPEEGLFFALEQAGAVRLPPVPGCGAEDVERAVHEPPENTRAAVRGLCVSRFADSVESAQWDHVTLRTRQGPWRIDLASLTSAASVARCVQAIHGASSPDDLRFATTHRK